MIIIIDAADRKTAHHRGKRDITRIRMIFLRGGMSH